MTSGSSFSTLAKSSYHGVLENVIDLGMGAVFWIILAKITDPGSIGQAMIINGLAMTMVAFSGQGVKVTLTKYISEYRAKNMPNSIRLLLRNGVKTSLIISGLMAVVFSLLSGQIATAVYQNPSLAILIVFTLLTFLPSKTVTAALQGVFHGTHLTQYITITDLIFQVSKLAFVIPALFYGLKTFGILLSFSVASFASLAICYFFLRRVMPKFTEKEESDGETKHVVHFATMNYFNLGAKTLSIQIGVLILGTQSFEMAAFYGLAVLISKLVGSFSRSVGGALLPVASENRINGNKIQLTKLVNTGIRVSLLLGGIGFIVLMIDPTYILHLISRSYAEAAWALRILAVSAIIAAVTSIFTSLLNASNRAADLAKIGVVSSAITIVLTFILVPMEGLEGAAIAMLVGSVLNLALSFMVVKRKEHLIISSQNIYKPFMAITSGLVVGYTFVFLGQVLPGVILALACYIIVSLASKATTTAELRRVFNIAVHRTKQ